MSNTKAQTNTKAGSIIKFLQKNMIWEVLVLMVLSVTLGRHYHDFFVSLKTFLPFALFLMLYKPMVYLNIGKAVAKHTEIKAKYFALLTFFYVIVFPLSAFLLMKAILFVLPDVNPGLVAGLVLLVLSPVATSTPAFVEMAGGKTQLALAGLIYTFFLSLLVMPLGSKLILEQVVKVPMGVLLKSLVIYVIVPLIIGQLTRYAVLKYRGKQMLEKLKIPLGALVLAGLFAMVIIVFGINGVMISKEPQGILYGALIMNIYFLLRWGLVYLTGNFFKIPLEQNMALTYSSTYNMTIATAMSIATFGPMAAVGTVIGGPFAEMMQMIFLVKFFEYVRKKRRGI